MKRLIYSIGAAIFFLSIICTAGCGRAVDTMTDPLAYRNTGFNCEVHGVLNGVEFSSLIHAYVGEREDCRMRVEYTSPTAVAGFCIERSNGVITIVSGDLSMAGDELSAMLLPCAAFFPDADVNILSLTQSERDGDNVTEVALSDGGLIVLDSVSEFPKCIFFENNELYIDWFEPLRG